MTYKPILAAIAAFFIGLYAGATYFPQHHYTKETIVEKLTIVEGEVKTVTDTQIAYIPKEVIKYIDPTTGQEITQLEKTDIDAQIGKQEINVRLNGQEVAFQKFDDEQFIFEKNKIALNQSSTVTFDVQVKPPVIDKTKRWSIGAGYGSNGLAGKIDFPIGKNERLGGGWVYGDKKTGAAGVSIKF